MNHPQETGLRPLLQRFMGQRQTGVATSRELQVENPPARPAPQRIVLPEGWHFEIPSGQGLNAMADLHLHSGRAFRMICATGGYFTTEGTGEDKQLFVTFMPHCSNIVSFFALTAGMMGAKAALFAQGKVTTNAFVEPHADTRPFRLALTEDEIAHAQAEITKEAQF